MKTLKLNSTGQLVKHLQLLLNILPDGIFGPQTQQSVIFFQKSQNITPDGFVGPITWSLLYDGWEMINNPNEDNESIYTQYFLPNHAYHNQPTEKKSIFLHHTSGWQNPYRVIDHWENDHTKWPPNLSLADNQSTMTTQNTMEKYFKPFQTTAGHGTSELEINLS